jgi:hypothetical protein
MKPTILNDRDLMAKIKTICGPWIDKAAAGTPYPAAFLAALTANESGGDIYATRLEPNVLGQLAFVFLGRKPEFGAITQNSLTDYVAEVSPSSNPRQQQRALLAELVELASSWGPTQIMGYQALARKYPVGDLPTLDRHYPHTIDMLDDFAKRFELATDAGMALFFHCWNAGSPTGRTFDPQYTSNGLSRMAIYQTL